MILDDILFVIDIYKVVRIVKGTVYDGDYRIWNWLGGKKCSITFGTRLPYIVFCG